MREVKGTNLKGQEGGRGGGCGSVCVGVALSSRKFPKEDTRAKGRPVREKGAGGGPQGAWA